MSGDSQNRGGPKLRCTHGYAAFNGVRQTPPHFQGCVGPAESPRGQGLEFLWVATSSQLAISRGCHRAMALAKTSLPREDTLGFAAGSSWLVMLQGEEEEGFPHPLPEAVGLSPRQFLAEVRLTQGLSPPMASPECLELSQSPSRPGAAGRAVPVARAGMIGMRVDRLYWCFSGSSLCHLAGPSALVLALGVCCGAVPTAAPRRFISEMCRAAWVGRGRRLSGGCCWTDLGSLKLSASHCH